MIRIRRIVFYPLLLLFLGSLIVGASGLYWWDVHWDDQRAISDQMQIPRKVFNEQNPLPIPPLQDILAGSEDLQTVNDWYDERREALCAMLESADNETRCRALFGMYITHISQPYGPSADPQTIAEWLEMDSAHCGTYAWMQERVYDALNVQWRQADIDGGWHVVVEARIDGQWESFDATTNIWLNRSMEEIIAGAERTYRRLYSPMADEGREDARRFLTQGLSARGLRDGLPLLGVAWFPGSVNYG